MYESPIEIIFRDIENRIREQEENAITAEVSRQIGVNVDKDELMKALAYDRGQYNKGYEDAKRVYGSPNLNEIIMSLIGWIKENDIVPEIIFYSVYGGIHLILKLSRGNNHMAHEFYIPGGVLSVENWKNGCCDAELDIFLENAKKQFAIQERIERDE